MLLFPNKEWFKNTLNSLQFNQKHIHKHMLMVLNIIYITK